MGERGADRDLCRCGYFIAMIGYAAVLALQKFPSYEPMAVMAVTMLVIFLSAGGFYQVASRTVAAVRNR